MGNCTNIGVYISESDKDIAAWFNMLQRNHMSRTRWVRGLLAANALGKPLRIGVINPRAPLIRSGPQQGDRVEPKGGYKYGWQIRGPEREFVVGSVVNLSLRGDETHDLLEEAWANGHKLSPFVKSLIRSALTAGDKDIPPKPDALRRIWSEYLVSVNGTTTGTKKKRSLLIAPEEPAADDWASDAGAKPEPVPEQMAKLASERPQEPQIQDPGRIISFASEPPQEAAEPPRKPNLGLNPLLSQI